MFRLGSMTILPRRTYQLLVVCALAWGCGAQHAEQAASTTHETAGGPASGGRVRSPSCPARAAAEARLPGVSPELERVQYWLERHADDLDAPLLTPPMLAVHERALRFAADGDLRIVDLTRAPDSAELTAALATRLRTLRERFASGEYRSEQEDTTAPLAPELPDSFVAAPSLRVALAPVALRCAPFSAPIRSTSGNPDLDRNSCSEARAQEPIEILGKVGGATLARTRYALGFIDAVAPLSPPVPAELDARYRSGQELELTRPLAWAGSELPKGTLLVAAGADHATLADASGFHTSAALGDGARSTARPLTRRTFLEAAFAHLGAPYGWGDQGGGRDCSRLVLDVLATFGLHLPRHSAEQSQAGSYQVDVPTEASETERLALLDETSRRGVVLAHFPGHIMFYLGRDAAGVPRALHAFAEYLTPCKDGGETLHDVGRVSVSGLELGKGTSRRSFLERITRLTVFGREPGHELLALSRFRRALPPPALEPGFTCRDDLDLALFRSPREPHAGAPLRVMAVTRDDSRPAGLWLVDPQGQVASAPVHELGVGPYGRWLEVASPAPGRWTALLADGERILACERIRVSAAPPAARPPRSPEAPAWLAPWAWERDTERLYAAFVEQLFSHPIEDLRTWSSLTELLRDRQRNLLIDHLGLGEDARLKLSPDCADLAYFLRAYFAWKVGLPFAFRQCARGREGVPPRCSALKTSATPIAAADDVAAFELFLRTQLGPGVHSASGRTLPEDDATDMYPLPLRRDALAPGSVFNDPYGHVIVVAKWVPQGVAGAGMLIGADAQPDATVGRRRFFRGNFLFTPDTRDVGAGFKAFRPIVESEPQGFYASLDAEALKGDPDHEDQSLEQYQGTADAFYARMDELIYPRPIALDDRLRQGVDALEEQVVRRVEAVDLGEAHVRSQRAPMSMPRGYDIFETTGAWEDFATPSRDMRLLIALDTVRSFPEQVAEAPARFGVTSPGPNLAAEVRARMAEELGKRRFRYTRSDGSPFELTLAQILERADALEVAYNPNDCVEVRWGAPADSAEAQTCTRRAPDEQQALLAKYRSWFHTRTRPPRP
jgi:cell wall-associated NlpC family hydrolase